MRPSTLSALVAALLLAPAALAQPSDDLTISVAYGNTAAERLLFPTDVDPDLTVGLRLAGLDLQAGITSARRSRTGLFRDEVLAIRDDEIVRVGMASVGVTRQLGRPLVQARLSVAHDRYSASRTAYRPDSVEIGLRDDREQVFGLNPTDRQSGEATFVHTGLSVSAGFPVGTGRLLATPAVGVAATLSGRVRGDIEAQGARWMPYVEVPVALRVRDLAVSVQARAGLTRDQLPRTPYNALVTGPRVGSTWSPIVEAAVGVEF